MKRFKTTQLELPNLSYDETNKEINERLQNGASSKYVDYKNIFKREERKIQSKLKKNKRKPQISA